MELEEESEEQLAWNQKAFEDYTYYDFEAMRVNWSFQADALTKGQELRKNRKLIVDEIKQGYLQNGEQMIDAYASGTERNYSFGVRVLVSKERILRTECECNQCSRNYYMTYYHGSGCGYVSALLEEVKEYVEKTRLGDATDYDGRKFLMAFQEQHANDNAVYPPPTEGGCFKGPAGVAGGTPLCKAVRRTKETV